MMLLFLSRIVHRYLVLLVKSITHQIMCGLIHQISLFPDRTVQLQPQRSLKHEHWHLTDYQIEINKKQGPNSTTIGGLGSSNDRMLSHCISKARLWVRFEQRVWFKKDKEKLLKRMLKNYSKGYKSL